ncbi:DUF4345 domain-containing protein [Alterisphingorhabdus coralli]|uniref:DUF4345 domain-containing protein n=1 Tax=Alterisphingorhabdus coralli TaxID=3071408 RepID=A0AA97HZD8_9SPHN|nr:DUF4345 domain-containing protein [Parasphingorhabdus sp. SCSIO 66989]WOE74524.1 DUF4345 domain-containing protein [Parasphingorhabdus sp. SCSIO 66989]
MRYIITRSALGVSGVILAVIGSSIMAAPRLFLATSEVIVEQDAGLMSEVTAPSGMLIITGAFMLLGAINLQFSRLGLVLGAIVYGSYGVSRFVSMYLHGMPSDSLMIVAYFELGVAAMLAVLNFAAPLSTAASVHGHFEPEG